MGVRREYMFQTKLDEAREMRINGVYLKRRTTRHGLVRLARTLSFFGKERFSRR